MTRAARQSIAPSKQSHRDKPDLPAHLLWEYDLAQFDYEKSFFIVIERTIERGTIEQWRTVQHYYGKEKMLEVARNSKQLSPRDKQFAELFVNSAFNAVSR